MSDAPPPKVAPFSFPDRYELPSRPSTATPAVQDAHRQTHFLLPSDMDMFDRAMNLQLAAVAIAAKRRTPEAAALLGYWSRTFSYLSNGCVLLTRAAYASCPPLLRTASDCLAAQRSLLGDGFDEYREWLATALGKDAEHAASYIELGRYRGGSALAQDERLGSAYRLLTDLSMPHFGSTLFLTGPESSQRKLALAFADGAFHLGWAELVAGWLLLLAGAQIETVLASDELGVAPALGADATRLGEEIAQALANPRRCRAEDLPDGRRALHNFRRAVSGTPRRLIL